MKYYQPFYISWQAIAIASPVLVAQPAFAQVVQVTEVQTKQTANSIEIILATSDGKQLQVFPSSFRQTYVANIPNAQLAQGKSFRQENPISGIASINVTQGTNSIRVTVTGTRDLPKVAVGRSDASGGLRQRALTLTLAPALAKREGVIAPTAQQPTPTPQAPAAQPESPTEPEPTAPQQQDDLTQEPVETEQPAESAQGEEEIEIVVTGEQEETGYSVPDGTTATKTDTPLRDIPQSIQVVPRQVLEDQNVTRISEAARNVSSVTVQRGFGNNTDNYIIRGFVTYDNLRNGFRDIDAYQSTANVERVEVLKGPASVLYGQFEPGGVVNYITKQPLSEPYYAGEFTIGSYDYYRPSIDISGPLNSERSLLYRLNVAYENFDSFVDFVNGETFSIAPVLTYKIGDTTTLNLEYEYASNNRDFYEGFLPEAVSFQLPISRNFAEPNSNPYRREINRAGLSVDHRFSENLRLRSAFSAFFSDESVLAVRARELEPDDRTVTRAFRDNKLSQTTYSWQTDLIGKFSTGSVDHQLLLGLEYVRDIRTDDCCKGAEVSGLDIFNPVYGSPLPTILEPGNFTETTSDTVGIYLQDQVALLSNLKLLLGGRIDFFNRNSEVTDGESGELEEDDLNETPFSPRVGLVYQPIEPISLYASYSRSFVPSDSQTVGGDFLPPTRGTQYEVGIKSEFFDGRLSATLAAYEITKTNVATIDPDNLDFSIAIGEVKSRGVEFDLAGELAPGWNVIASYFVNDAFVNVGDENNPEGDSLVNAPEQGGSLWTTYEIQSGNLQGLGFGAGVFFVGDREAELPNDLIIPSYVRADAAIFYKRDNWRIGLNFKNLFDKKYYDSQGFYLLPGAPFTVLGSVSVEF